MKMSCSGDASCSPPPERRLFSRSRFQLEKAHFTVRVDTVSPIPSPLSWPSRVKQPVVKFPSAPLANPFPPRYGRNFAMRACWLKRPRYPRSDPRSRIEIGCPQGYGRPGLPRHAQTERPAGRGWPGSAQDAPRSPENATRTGRPEAERPPRRAQQHDVICSLALQSLCVRFRREAGGGPRANARPLRRTPTPTATAAGVRALDRRGSAHGV